MVGTEAEPDWERVEALFHAALDRAPETREAFLARECAGDAALRAEVDGLLAADDEAETFLGDADRARAAAPLVAGELPRRLGAWRLLEVIGEGGMGLVYRAERADGAFEQQVAIKMLRPGPATGGLVARFDAERRTLARLTHPGIARVLDAGEDGAGAPWLAMELVDGEPIDDWCDARRLGVRARVELIAAVCDAVAHAHDQLVVHRDLKPHNILVDGEGLPRLLDFGIAKVLDDGDDALALTETGQRTLTPAYAAPEQLRGEASGTRTDVFALGVVLYELLTGARPHGRTTTSRGELEREILERDPEAPSAVLAQLEGAGAIGAARGGDVRALRRQLAGDLDRIVLTALRKEPHRRYGSAVELADELRRWLGGLPVRARGDGFAYRAGKLVRRRPIETALAASLVLALAVGAASFVDASLRDRERLAEIQRLGDMTTLDALRAEADELWPIHPDLVPRYRAWLAAARDLLSRRALHEATLARWGNGAEADGAARDDWRAWTLAQFESLNRELGTLESPDRYGPTIAALEWRLERASNLERRSLTDAADAWQAVLERLADDPRFAGLELAPRLGLVPLGPDPDGGLEAFWPIETGDRPTRADDGRFVPSAGGGLVLLLVPGGRVVVGSQPDDPDAPRHDPHGDSNEGPPEEVRLDAYLLSKFEVTQGQWERWTGRNPSDYGPNSKVGDRRFGPLSPVERVSASTATDVLRHFALQLPTEAQWETAMRAGTDSIWPTGDDERSLVGYANLPDRYAREHGGGDWVYSDWLDDGHTVHAPVGSYRPNAWGFHDMAGNLWEWCRDAYWRFDQAALREGDGLRGAGRELPAGADITARGGSFGTPPGSLRSSKRYAASPTLESRSTGLRPARAWR